MIPATTVVCLFTSSVSVDLHLPECYCARGHTQSRRDRAHCQVHPCILITSTAGWTAASESYTILAGLCQCLLAVVCFGSLPESIQFSRCQHIQRTAHS